MLDYPSFSGIIYAPPLCKNAGVLFVQLAYLAIE